MCLWLAKLKIGQHCVVVSLGLPELNDLLSIDQHLDQLRSASFFSQVHGLQHWLMLLFEASCSYRCTESSPLWFKFSQLFYKLVVWPLWFGSLRWFEDGRTDPSHCLRWWSGFVYSWIRYRSFKSVSKWKKRSLTLNSSWTSSGWRALSHCWTAPLIQGQISSSLTFFHLYTSADPRMMLLRYSPRKNSRLLENCPKPTETLPVLLQVSLKFWSGRC